MPRLSSIFILFCLENFFSISESTALHPFLFLQLRLYSRVDELHDLSGSPLALHSRVLGLYIVQDTGYDPLDSSNQIPEYEIRLGHDQFLPKPLDISIHCQ